MNIRNLQRNKQRKQIKEWLKEEKVSKKHLKKVFISQLYKTLKQKDLFNFAVAFEENKMEG